MPPKGSKSGPSGSHSRQAVTKKTKDKKADKKEDKAPRPKVLEREAKKAEKKEAKAEKKEKAFEDLEAGVTPKAVSQKQGGKTRAKTRTQDRKFKEASRFGDEE